MIKGINTTFWEILHDGVLYPCFDSLPGNLGFPRNGSDHSTRRVLSCCLFFVSISICFYVFTRNRKEYDIHTRVALQALLTIVTPTCSLWPKRYVKLANTRSSIVGIPLEMIIEDTTVGVVELRDPINDLVDLIDSGVTVNGHTICITISWKWWIKCLEWWMLAKYTPDHSTSHLPSHAVEPSEWLNNHDSGSPLSLNPFILTSASYPLLSLDHLPGGMIPPLNAGCKVTFEFTTFSSSLRTSSTAQIISLIPFIVPGRLSRRPRPLIAVVKQLNDSYGSNLVIDAILNVSADREHTLRHAHESCSREQGIREMWIKIFGVKEWRREMFLVALEAALLRRGWIERWTIQVTTK